MRSSARLKTSYDVVILGAGHNGLVAASYLARAGLSVLLLEKNNHAGGAATSQRIFPEYDAKLSRYAYLVSLLPEKIIRDLGLKLELRRREIASFTPWERNGTHGGLLFSNLSEGPGRESLRALTGNDKEYERLIRFQEIARTFAENIWDTMLEPLRNRAECEKRFAGSELGREAWRAIVAEPLGRFVECTIENDLLRGVVFTDAKIGLLTHPDDPSLLQNRCFIYHIIGNGTGEWKVPVGGMGRVSDELCRAAMEAGAELVTGARVTRLAIGTGPHTVEFETGDKVETVDARFILANCGKNVLASLIGQNYEPDATHEGAVLKINMLLTRLPRVRSVNSTDAFRGTFHIDEGYDQMRQSYSAAVAGHVPEKIPCEIYCHTLTDNSILAPELRERGFHTLTLFGLDTPWRLFANDNGVMRDESVRRCLAGLNQYLEEPIENCLARTSTGEFCLEAHSPVDIERELGQYRGNIFHAALSFPFAEHPEETGTWGVETEFRNVFICGSSARRGGAVSGIPGHNAAMKVLEVLGKSVVQSLILDRGHGWLSSRCLPGTR